MERSFLFKSAFKGEGAACCSARIGLPRTDSSLLVNYRHCSIANNLVNEAGNRPCNGAGGKKPRSAFAVAVYAGLFLQYAYRFSEMISESVTSI